LKLGRRLREENGSQGTMQERLGLEDMVGLLSENGSEEGPGGQQWKVDRDSGRGQGHQALHGSSECGDSPCRRW
jgi:hypothetical protein